ncbi:phosphoribosylamine--glycine ligase [Planococcus glaciei]|uniref:Phosphoribosylamine--glycine ligase n=1 Tax=Planococcus glaciei TaxID=459472 RepID=A0A7H8QCP0_9BACL|nr:phosphoribosylamine--glycine ligase [Planococcus glaciei]ETP68940.1 phosphoribosylamine--glycine ligase [Planococcus glaciei CHR43]KOF09686.1 phosphoribosylamine--glycine ligase [Planococcus glaciei]QDY45990.1 phosphoribosylamine--glycine ligase [Planococcus glaciei]QKX51271.1 phosphoribosylamine--glycine ligase [Planococcus glaciei]
MKVMVIGRGGREHAIARQFSRSASVEQVYAAPGNDGMAEDAAVTAIDEMDFSALADFAEQQNIDFTFVGPEQPLAAGIVDFFEERGLRIFGPSKAAAQIEGSKAFAKELMKKYEIPTAAYETFTETEPAIDFIRKHGTPIVIKADGLAAGKGVVVAESEGEAIAAVKDMLDGQKFGDSGSRVVIEEFLDGEEFSFMSFVQNGQIYPMVISQDHKRAYDGDRGPNTGGMGAYSPVPQISDSVVKETYAKIVVPAVEAMEAEGTPFNGILYAGIILTEQGPKVIEFNARFGDPETQVVLPRMQSDFGAFMDSLLKEKPFELEWNEQAVLGVVLAAEGYPESAEKGQLLPDLQRLDGVEITHAGTKRIDSGFAGNGGRVLLVAAAGASIAQAQDKVYEQLNKLRWDGFFYRSDIGWRAK